MAPEPGTRSNQGKVEFSWHTGAQPLADDHCFELVFWSPDKPADKRSPVGAGKATRQRVDFTLLFNSSDPLLRSLAHSDRDFNWGVRIVVVRRTAYSAAGRAAGSHIQLQRPIIMGKQVDLRCPQVGMGTRQGLRNAENNDQYGYFEVQRREVTTRLPARTDDGDSKTTPVSHQTYGGKQVEMRSHRIQMATSIWPSWPMA